MHTTTKLTPVMRKEVYGKWRKSGISLRDLAKEYHVDKKVVQRIIARGKEGDFSVHTSVNIRYLPKKRSSKNAVKKRPQGKRPHTKKTTQRS